MRPGSTPPQQLQCQKRIVYRTGGTWASKYSAGRECGAGVAQDIRNWDFAPTEEYWRELFRVSKRQIVWGGNYFDLPPTRCFLVWDKSNIPDGFSMAQCEYAWCSFNANAKIFRAHSGGNANYVRFHPTQKPVALYVWILENFAQKGWRLLDTHGGSMDSAIAAYRLGYDMDICEINDVYFEKGKANVEREMRQLNLF